MTTNSTYGKPQVIVTGGGRSPDSVCHPAPPAPDVHPSLRHPAPPAPTPGDFVPKRMLTTPVAHV